MKTIKMNATGMIFYILQETDTDYIVWNWYHNLVEVFTKVCWNPEAATSNGILGFTMTG
jgi:hypothetical protein